LKLLLDTHIWIWLLQNPGLLASKTLKTLRDPASELWLSPVSTWEALTLHRKGRLDLPADLDSWLLRATEGMQQADLTHEIALASARLQMHGDPADRFLVATAEVLDLTLVTADRKLLGFANIRTMANR
jgi:PIN domain nuclease of toxin-antitoxin system